MAFSKSISNMQLVCLLFILFFNIPTNPQQINDPFPGNVGPEDPPATVAPYTGCPAECSAKLDEAMKSIGELEKKIADLSATVGSRIDSIGPGGSAGPTDLSSRISQVETYLYQNMTATTDKLSTDLTSSSTSLTEQINDARSYIENRLASGGGASGGEGGADAASPVFKNITDRLDDLEHRKVQLLINENNVWRRNFEVVNKTFSKMRKSSYSNEVIVVG